MDSNTITIIVIVGIGLLIGLIVYLLTFTLKKRRYDEQKHVALLEDIRESMELQMYRINDRLNTNEERWKDVNHLLIQNRYTADSAIAKSQKRVYYSDFLKSNGIVENDLLIDEKLVFILTPFHDKFAEEYSIIKNTCAEVGFTAMRGDETFFKGDIFPEMLKLVVKARLIIANTNGRNPNVFYELGIAQALDKPVLLLSNQPATLPIDLQSKRFLIFKDLQNLQSSLRDELIALNIK